MSSNQFLLDANDVGVLHSHTGQHIVINHVIESHGSIGGPRSVKNLAEIGLIDAIIVETEDGFSQLGMMRRFVSWDLGLEERNLVRWALDGFSDKLERNIASLADWNRFKNTDVTLIAIPSETQHSHLKGLILAPYGGSECYRQYAGWDYGTPRPYRDFIYNVTYEAIAHAYKTFGARRIALTHCSRNKYMTGYHRDLTTCQVEAIVHFCNLHRDMHSFTFLDEHPGNQPLQIVQEFNAMTDVGIHRGINTRRVIFAGISFVNLDWKKGPDDLDPLGWANDIPEHPRN